MPSSRATSSTSDSTAHSAAGAAGARYACTRGLLFSTSHATERKFAILYGPNAAIAPAVNDDAGYAPDS